jgi:hypothetical protein
MLIGSLVFGAMTPKTSVELLADTTPQFAQNVRLSSGAVEPWRLPANVAGVTMPGASEKKTIYRYGKDTASRQSYWFQFDGDVDIVRGPVALDTSERTYWTDGTYPKKTKSDLAGLTAGVAITPASLRMGIPVPATAPVATVTGTATLPVNTDHLDVRGDLRHVMGRRGRPGQRIEHRDMACGANGQCDPARQRGWRLLPHLGAPVPQQHGQQSHDVPGGDDGIGCGHDLWRREDASTAR